MSRQLNLHLLRKSDTVDLKARTLGLAGRGIHKHKQTPRHTGRITTNITADTGSTTTDSKPTSTQLSRHRVRSQLSQRMKWATITETATGIDPDTIPETIPTLRHAVREESLYSSLRDEPDTPTPTTSTNTTDTPGSPTRPPWDENPSTAEPAKYLNTARRTFIRRTLAQGPISTTTSSGIKELSTSYERIAYIEHHTSLTTGHLLPPRPDFFFSVGEPDPTRTHWTDRSPPPRHEAVPEWYKGETSTIKTAQDWKKAGETVRGNPKLIWKKFVKKRVVKRLKTEMALESSRSRAGSASPSRSGSGSGSGSGVTRRLTPGSPGLMTAMRRLEEAKALKESLKRAR
ncbi:hypothetical protein HRR83_005370 [Exophiala dermatitidis]|uniref:Uncharacterized protein n=2 Tax=Exophiala dermatitidis TaxID=5970 RepID=H6C1D5_EXODN|nr:uncharacterized protein HMPREF1120_05747 [Exophiala dermatitidis NIH/UT8656]KAJ4513020.1 hypothetical protein HRR75_004787 [Exophiala dermatitidis]EHY57720.1 hypothetical protein HMPREF1120_05747 [Exophiala dermatitidis NIH/UT8656]KAJ4516066.1 hypothetical protein HRR74_005223 [Exophiala dermatitidis]KAJ4518529.1 hypothetical protein HRR73_004110 [Exophiala dermatitidis]KAJ4534029.1 hypothetical protein HRR76_005975 [Exophiala dermatitidis]